MIPRNTRPIECSRRLGTERRSPISLVYRKDKKREGDNPLLLYGYGSYGISQRAAFSPYRISLLDRGFVYAIAHIRGGQELGRNWYENGKLLTKKKYVHRFHRLGPAPRPGGHRRR